MNRWQRPTLLAGLVLLAATFHPVWGQNEETLDPVLLGQWLGLDLNDPAVANGDADGDGLPAWLELSGGREGVPTSPLAWDTDGNGQSDADGLTHAYIPFSSACKFGDTLWYFFPAFLNGVGVSTNGDWTASGWHIPRDTPANEGAAEFDLDRAALGTNADLRLTLLFTDHPGSLRVDLLDTNGAPVRVGETELRDVVGNLEEGTGEAVEVELGFALGSFPDVQVIRIRRENGEMTLREARLYPATDESVKLDATGASAIGSDRTSGGAPSVSKPAVASGVDTNSTPAKSAVKTAAATTAKSVSAGAVAPRTALGGRSSGAAFVITRQVADSGGKRQSGTDFVMEDSIGQGTPIGLAWGPDFVLHAGYQQADECRLPFIWNLGVIHTPFNPGAGETTTVSYVLSEGAAVTVTLSNGTDVATLTNAAWQSQGLHTLLWNGWYNGAPAPQNSTWIVNIASVCGTQGVAAATSVTVKRNLPVLQLAGATPDPFCGATVLTYTVEKDIGNNPDVVIEMLTAKGAIVTAVTNKNMASGVYTQTWTGTDAPQFGSGGTLQPDGLYVYRVREEGGGGNQANGRTGVIVKACSSAVTNYGEVTVWHPSGNVVTVQPATGAALTAAMLALMSPTNILQSQVYEITASPTNFSPAAVVAFEYDPVLAGLFGDKLQLRRFDPVSNVWRQVAWQYVDALNHRILASLDNFSLYALFTGEDTTAPLIAIQSPEAMEYAHTNVLAVSYTVEDPAGIAETRVWLDGERYDEPTLDLSGLPGEHELTVEAWDLRGNYGRASVRFTVYVAVDVRIEPEVLKVNPGVLTAFVTFPAPYVEAVNGIVSATCEGAAYERLNAGDSSDKVILKYRREDVEAALTAAGQTLDTYFVVRGTWTNAVGTYVFQGADTINRIE